MHYQNVHATGWCSSAHLDRNSAIRSADRMSHGFLGQPHPQGPIVGRVRVQYRPRATLNLPLAYLSDALARGIVKASDFSPNPAAHADMASRFDVIANEKMDKADRNGANREEASRFTVRALRLARTKVDLTDQVIERLTRDAVRVSQPDHTDDPDQAARNKLLADAARKALDTLMNATLETIRNPHQLNYR